MSLTQERINEIAIACWKLYHNRIPFYSVEEMFSFFLSRIREEQEPYGYRIENHASIVFTRNKEISENGGGFPLFAIPPAAPESDCKELVEALEKIVNGYDADVEMGDDFSTILKRDVIEAKKAIAKHKASMGEK